MEEVQLKRLEITADYESADWSKVIPVLMAYAYVLLGNVNPRMARSREELAYDFSIDAITKYLNKPEKFNPSRNPDLIRYLKYNILKQLISNAKKKAANVNEVTIEANNGDYELDSDSVNNLFVEEYQLDDNIDIASIVAKIEEAIENDDELYEIFIGRYHHESERREICQDLNISTDEYDNRIRRIRRITRRILDSVK